MKIIDTPKFQDNPFLKSDFLKDFILDSIDSQDRGSHAIKVVRKSNLSSALLSSRSVISLKGDNFKRDVIGSQDPFSLS